MILHKHASLQLAEALEISTYDVTQLLTRIMNRQKSSALEFSFSFGCLLIQPGIGDAVKVSSRWCPLRIKIRIYEWLLNVLWKNEREKSSCHRCTHARSQTFADYFWPGHSFICLCGFSICIILIMKCWLCGMFDLNDFGIHWYYWLRNVIYAELIKIAETNIRETNRTLPVPVSSGEQNYLGNTVS